MIKYAHLYAKYYILYTLEGYEVSREYKNDTS